MIGWDPVCRAQPTNSDTWGDIPFVLPCSKGRGCVSWAECKTAVKAVFLLPLVRPVKCSHNIKRCGRSTQFIADNQALYLASLIKCRQVK